MVTGILTIPLRGHEFDASRELNSGGLREFVAGSENALAATAIRPFLERTATPYNPLVLYGPHGSGKSHLAYGLAAWWSQHFPTAGVWCLPASQFAQDYAAALEAQQLEAWRGQVRASALLIIDDIAQLGPHRGAQLELLHAFEELTDRGALVVVTARALPTHSSALLSALRSRLSAGLAVPLALPAAASRRAILEQFTGLHGIGMPKPALNALAQALEVSVPGLIAAVLELELSARTSGGPVDAQQVREFISARAAASMPSLRDIARVTAKYFGLKLSDLKSPFRQQPLVAARGVAMYLARQLTDKSLQQIGTFFGRRDHTTVINGCRRTETLARHDRATRQAVAELERLLTAP